MIDVNTNLIQPGTCSTPPYKTPALDCIVGYEVSEMWLLDVDTLLLKEFVGNMIPPYAILSHTWGSDEVTFVDMKKLKHRDEVRQRRGFSKIEGCCARAKEGGYAWAWVDSCCIDKRSSAELSEALNSMFDWYQSAAVCYVYLSDVSNDEDVRQTFKESRWFTRGWTLQELLASRNITFFAKDWSKLGYMGDFYELSVGPEYVDHGISTALDMSPFTNLTSLVSDITHIPTEYLSREKRLEQACVAQRMYWAAQRRTTRPEDRAYSLMGIFDIKMPIIYGEGPDKAFARLQREICNETPDQSIFAWHHSDMISYRLLADSPQCFKNSGDVVWLGQETSLGPRRASRSAFYLTNLGLRITLPLFSANKVGSDYYKGQIHANLHCFIKGSDGNYKQLGLSLTYLDTDLGNRAIYMCRRPNQWVFVDGQGLSTSIFIRGMGYDAKSPEEPLASPAYEPDIVEIGIANIIAHAVHSGSYEKQPHQYLKDDMTFSELGIDSLSLIEIMFRARSEFGLEIYTMDFYDHPTVGKFIKFIASVAETKSRRPHQ